MNGKYAISTAGRDAGKLYIIVGNEEGMLLLADGKERTLVKPKKKNVKHVEVPLQEKSEKLAEMIGMRHRGCDEEIRQTLHHLWKDELKYK
ncbi:MAG: KOW domain-containing RNA-binding protein [Lachnospiraceae bacterium]|nr:KOW domain-containing RNA-binding protein [Lachnospiraceae bacterium]